MSRGRPTLGKPREAEEGEGFESHQLSMDSIEWIPAGDEVFIRGLGPCLGIVLFDPHSGEALAGHLTIETPLNRLLDRLKEKHVSIESCSAYVGGVSTEADKGIHGYGGRQDTAMSYRKYVLKTLIEKGIAPSGIHVRFNDNPRVGMALVFDTKTKEFRSEEE